MAKLTSEQLRKLVREEVGNFGKMKSVEDSKAKETDADEYADSLEKPIDMLKALKIEEGKLKAQLAKVQERKAQVLSLLAK